MAHPPDPALSKAIGTALRSLRERGWNTRDIATKLGVADPTVSRWENGNRLPALDMLPRIDALCGMPTGYVLTVAGYVDLDNLVDLDDPDEAAIWSTRVTYSPAERIQLIAGLRNLKRDRRPRARKRRTG